MPADLELNPEQSFSDLQVNEEDPYRSYVFPVTFADGEARKQLRITAFVDEKSEAIKAGYRTGALEREALVRRVLGSDDLKYCPHGRPICIRLTKGRIERQFGRA